MQVNSVLARMREQIGHLHAFIEPLDDEFDSIADDSFTTAAHSFIVNYNQYLMCNIKQTSLLWPLLLIIPLLLLIVVLFILLKDVTHLLVYARCVLVKLDQLRALLALVED